ncbi:hypothetical protein [Microcoleus sp. herbarium12]
MEYLNLAGKVVDRSLRSCGAFKLDIWGGPSIACSTHRLMIY